MRVTDPNVLAFVVVSGPPGSGKSSLASVLSKRFGLPLFSKDTIKEALMSALGAPHIEASRRLGAASIQVLSPSPARVDAGF